MKRNKDWQQFEDFLAEEFKEIAPHVTHTKGSRYGDLKNLPGLHVEAKSYDNVNVYKEEWLKKCLEEIPLHSDKMGIVVTKNKNNDVRVHMSWFDFKDLFFEWYILKYGDNNGK